MKHEIALPGMDVSNFTTGMHVTFTTRPRWYVRLWRWIRRILRCPYIPPTLTVLGVDRERGEITVGDSP